eukprot:3556793-Rhodomonas_salina.3
MRGQAARKASPGPSARHAAVGQARCLLLLGRCALRLPRRTMMRMSARTALSSLEAHCTLSTHCTHCTHTHCTHTYCTHTNKHTAHTSTGAQSRNFLRPQCQLSSERWERMVAQLEKAQQAPHAQRRGVS